VIEIATPGLGGEPVEMSGPPSLPSELPILPLRDTVAFPDTLTPLAVGQERSIRLVNDVLGGNRMLAMVARRFDIVLDDSVANCAISHADSGARAHCRTSSTGSLENVRMNARTRPSTFLRAVHAPTYRNRYTPSWIGVLVLPVHNVSSNGCGTTNTGGYPTRSNIR